MRSLLWSLVMLSLIMYIFSLIFMQSASEYLARAETDPEKRRELIEYWGTVYASMDSLFQAISGGNDWSQFATPLRAVGEHYYLAFLFFILFLCFAVLNILTGVFIDGAQQSIE